MDYDVIFLPGYYEEGGLIIKQAREMGIAQPILGPDGFANSTLVESAGAINVDVMFYAMLAPNSEDPKVQEFLACLKQSTVNLQIHSRRTAVCPISIRCNRDC